MAAAAHQHPPAPMRPGKAAGLWRAAGCLALLGMGTGLAPAQAASADAAAPTAEAPRSARCTQGPDDACLQSLDLPGGAGRLRYYASQSPAQAGTAGPQSLLLVMHGHPRDAGRSFAAGLDAARGAGRGADTLVVAPLFQVPADAAARCSTPGTPPPQPGDALWTCASWLDGRDSQGAHPISSFAALDALLADLAARWPSLRQATVAGFSAGAQMLQHRIAFAAEPPAGWQLRYVIADPGSWLYFDPVRPRPVRDGSAEADWAGCTHAPLQGTLAAGCRWEMALPAEPAACPAYDQWKYGTQQRPTPLDGPAAAALRARYAAADIHVLEGSLDSAPGRGTAYGVLDKSCGAQWQGPFRLQRGLAYAAYEQAVLRPTGQRTFTVVPGCAHDVACVLPSPQARAALFGPPR